MTASSDTAQPESSGLAQTVTALQLNAIARHVFLCADQTKPKCCDKAASIAA